MAKKRLLLIVGAGASLEFGMPSVKAVRDIINEAAQRYFPLLESSSTNLYEFIERMILDHWGKNVPAKLRRDPQFEDVLYAIFALASAYPAGVNTSALGALVSAKRLPDVNFVGLEAKTVGRVELDLLGSSCVAAVVADFRDRCKVVQARKAADLVRLKQLLGAFRAEYDLSVVSLNYDNLIHRMLPDIELGFSPADGRFYEDRILVRKDWPCMLHLHGSVHFDMREGESGDLAEIYWQPDLGEPFAQNAFGRGSVNTAEGPTFPTSTIVAGYGKTSQILRRPFRTYYSELDRLVSTCDCLLFAGYGFGDVHLNMAFGGFRDARRRPVAVITLCDDNTLTAGCAGPGDHNICASAVLELFQTARWSMRSLGSSLPKSVAELKSLKEFETSNDPSTPTFLWYSGMLAACDHPDKILSVLS